METPSLAPSPMPMSSKKKMKDLGNMEKLRVFGLMVNFHMRLIHPVLNHQMIVI